MKPRDLASGNYHTALDSNVLLISNIAYNASVIPEYMGLSAPGTADNAAAWMIRKIIYDGNQNPISIRFAGGNANFDKVWDNRANYIYS